MAALACSQCKIASKKRLEKGMCHTCYERQRMASKPLLDLTCLKCGPVRVKKLTRNLCGTCYSLQCNRRKLSICINCKKEKLQIFVKGFCQTCYSAQDRVKNPKIYKKYQITHRDEIRIRNSLWRKNNLQTHSAAQANRRASKIKATPIWANKCALKEIYKGCPRGMHVDHIIPLKNDLVCGLHVPENLQYLTFEENVLKSNKFDGTSENNGWRFP